MVTKIITIILGLTVLALGLNYGSPVEITFQPGHRIGVLILTVLIGLTYYILIRQSLKLNKIKLKNGGLGLIGLTLLPYLWIGLWTVIPAVFSDDYPMMEDISEYSNDSGERVIGQFMEISGSLHHYQNRKVIYDFGNGIRISYLFPDNKINGTWTYHRFGFNNGIVKTTETTYTAKFKSGREIK